MKLLSRSTSILFFPPIGSSSVHSDWLIVPLAAALSLAAAGCEGRFYAENGDAREDATEGVDIPDIPGAEGDAAAQEWEDAAPDMVEPFDIPGDPEAGDALHDPETAVDPEYDNDLCGGTGIVDRLRVTLIDVSPNRVSGGAYQQTVVLSPLPDGGSMVAWNDEGGSAHVTPLTPGDTRGGPDHVLPDADISGFTAHPDGSAILGVRGDAMILWRLDAAGAALFEEIFVGNNDHSSSGDKWIDWWSDCGRLAWSGNRYGVYFGHTQNWGAEGNHQGDLYTLVDGAGNNVGGGWDWGCSHSLEVRLAWNGSVFGPVCLSDCYPTRGIHINGYWGTEISSEPSGNCAGGSAASLGGLVPAPDGFFLTFTSPEGRSSSDVALVHVASSGAPGPKVYLTDTPGVDERGAKLARYGDDLLAAWMAGGSALFAVVSESGMIREGPEVVAAQLDPHDDFVNFADGAAGWAYGSGSDILVARLGLCP